MSLSVLSVLGVVALGGGIAAGLSLLTGIRLLGDLLEAVEDPGGPPADEADGGSR
jgi:hypothetical protein